MNKTPYFLLRLVLFVLLVFLLKFTFADTNTGHSLDLAYPANEATRIELEYESTIRRLNTQNIE